MAEELSTEAVSFTPEVDTIGIETEGPKNPFDLNPVVNAVVRTFLYLEIVAIISLNSGTIAAVLRYKALRASNTNLYIVYLSIADCLLAPSILSSMTAPPEFDRRLNFLLGQTLTSVSFRLSCWTMTLIAIDRLVAVGRPHAYRRVFTRARAHVVVIVVWAVIIGILLGSDIYGILTADPMALMIGRRRLISQVLDDFMIMPLLYLPLILNVCLYAIIFILMKKQARKIAPIPVRRTGAPGNKDDKKQERMRKQNRRLVKLLMKVLLGMIITILPFTIILSSVNLMDPDSAAWVPYIYIIGLILQISNGFLNPLIYCWQGADWRKAYVNLLCCKNDLP